MTIDLDELDLFPSPAAPRAGAAPAKRCLHPRVARVTHEGGASECTRCSRIILPDAAKRGRNNRARGNKEELVVAREVGGIKVGPLGHPWDVEMPGYARLQVRKVATPASLRSISRALAAIGSGAEMPGYVWIEPGRGGERLIVFRLGDFAERHGVEVEP